MERGGAKQDDGYERDGDDQEQDVQATCAAGPGELETPPESSVLRVAEEHLDLHALMCEYLFAAFTLKERTDEGVIADQEMLHLALVSNLLSAVGMSPHLVRPNMPHPARHYPPGVTVTLLPFGEPALRHFLFLERPEGMMLADPKSSRRPSTPYRSWIPTPSRRCFSLSRPSDISTARSKRDCATSSTSGARSVCS